MLSTYLKLAVISLFAANINLALANEATITSNKAISFDYQVVYKTSKGVVYGPRQHANIANSVTVPFENINYELAGIVALAVDGHELPSNVNQFNQPAQCSLTTDKTQNKGVLHLIYTENEQHHGRKISCSPTGGIFG